MRSKPRYITEEVMKHIGPLAQPIANAHSTMMQVAMHLDGRHPGMANLLREEAGRLMSAFEGCFSEDVPSPTSENQDG